MSSTIVRTAQGAGPEGNIVKWSWFQFYENAPSKESDDMIIQSWDTASKTSELSDYSVCTTWHIKGNRYYLLDLLRKKLAYPDLRRAVIDQAWQYNARYILIEDTAAGTSLIQDIRHQNLRGINSPIAVKPEGEKAIRLSNQSAKIEAGDVYLPKKAPWLEEFRKELMAFPNGAHDDQVDSVSQFLNWVDWRARHTIHVKKLTGF